MKELRKTVYHLWLGFELNTEYYSCIASRLYRGDLYSKIFLACVSVSGGGIGGWAIWHDEQRFPKMVVIWTILTGIGTVFSIALPFLNFAKKVEFATRLKTEYSELARDSKLFWLKFEAGKVSTDDAYRELKKYSDREHKLNALESNFPTRNTGLAKKCQGDIERRLGLRTKGELHERREETSTTTTATGEDYQPAG